MGRRVLRRHIWGFSLCLCPIKGTPGLNELKIFIFYLSYHRIDTYFVEFEFQQESPSPKATSPRAKHSEKNAPPSPTQADKPPVNPTQSEDVPYCIALYDFLGETPEDLSFVPGDRIELLEHVGTDWLKGLLRGNTGIFPAAFVEIHKDLAGTVI